MIFREVLADILSIIQISHIYCVETLSWSMWYV